MIDIFGEELQIGDSVICCNQNYATLCVGTITGFTAKRIRVKYVRPDFSDGNYDYQREQLKERFQVCKVKSDFDLITHQKAEIERLKNCTTELFTLVEKISDNACKRDFSLFRANGAGGCDMYQGMPPICRIKDDLWSRYNLKEMVGEK